MTREIVARPLTREAFAPFGQVIAADGATSFPINAGMTDRFHDLATIELEGEAPRPLISIFRGRPYALPLALSLLERHPLGSQAFFPLGDARFLVIVAPDDTDGPGHPRAFLPHAGQGVNIARNVWHGVLTPLGKGGDFLVVDRGGEGVNLEEFRFEAPWTVRLPSPLSD